LVDQNFVDPGSGEYLLTQHFCQNFVDSISLRNILVGDSSGEYLFSKIRLTIACLYIYVTRVEYE
jgi:hypothetical protein